MFRGQATHNFSFVSQNGTAVLNVTVFFCTTTAVPFRGQATHQFWWFLSPRRDVSAKTVKAERGLGRPKTAGQEDRSPVQDSGRGYNHRFGFTSRVKMGIRLPTRSRNGGYIWPVGVAVIASVQTIDRVSISRLRFLSASSECEWCLNDIFFVTHLGPRVLYLSCFKRTLFLNSVSGDVRCAPCFPCKQSVDHVSVALAVVAEHLKKNKNTKIHASIKKNWSAFCFCPIVVLLVHTNKKNIQVKANIQAMDQSIFSVAFFFFSCPGNIYLRAGPNVSPPISSAMYGCRMQ